MLRRIASESTSSCHSDLKAAMKIPTETSGKASLQTFAMLLEINRKRLLKIKMSNYGGPFKKVHVTCYVVISLERLKIWTKPEAGSSSYHALSSNASSPNGMPGVAGISNFS